MKTFRPNVSIIVIVVILVVSGVVLIVNKNRQNAPVNQDSTLAASAEKSGDVGEYYNGVGSPYATGSATPLPKAVDIAVYVYPGSTIKSSTSTKMELESMESAEVITDWYKTKIRDSNFNAKSFSQANTNGNVFNKLTAAKPGEKLDITIKKDQTGSKVLITVDRS